jgi:hypothetical protein
VCHRDDCFAYTPNTSCCLCSQKFLNYDKPDVFFSPAQRNLLVYYILNNTKYAEDGTKVRLTQPRWL